MSTLRLTFALLVAGAVMIAALVGSWLMEPIFGFPGFLLPPIVGGLAVPLTLQRILR